MSGLGIDWAALWAAGGVWAIIAVGAVIIAIILVARWDRGNAAHSDPVMAAISKLSEKVDHLTLASEKRLTALETRLDDQQRQIDRMDR